MANMVTINDVAREAGVSKTTVSYVISHNPRIPHDTQERVRRAMKKLGYSVNHTARALSTSKTMTLGLLVSGQNDGMPLSLTRGAYLCELSKFARQHGYDLLLISNPDGVQAIRELASARKVDGLILMDLQRNDVRVAAAVESKLPTVLLGVPSDSLGLDVVDTDFERAAHELIRRFVNQGHRDIALVHTSESPKDDGANYAVRFRQAALTEARAAGITLRVPPMDVWDLNPAEHIRTVLNRFPTASGLLIDDDNAVIAAPQALLELGIHVPEDLSVAVVVPDVIHQRMRIPYTAVNINLSAVAEETIDTLIRRISKPDSPSVTRLVSQPLNDCGSIIRRDAP